MIPGGTWMLAGAKFQMALTPASTARSTTRWASRAGTVMMARGYLLLFDDSAKLRDVEYRNVA